MFGGIIPRYTGPRIVPYMVVLTSAFIAPGRKRLNVRYHRKLHETKDRPSTNPYIIYSLSPIKVIGCFYYTILTLYSDQ